MMAVMAAATHSTDPGAIAQRILVLRGQRVLLIEDLASLYGVTARRLSEQVRRNGSRFPADFTFRISIKEIQILVPQIAAPRWGGRRGETLAFTEHGAIMAATVLNSPRAVEMSVYVVRAFVKLREILASNAELARKLAALEKSVATLDATMRKQFEDVYAAIRALMTPPAKKTRPIGFTAELE
jgi:hypothetical protein